MLNYSTIGFSGSRNFIPKCLPNVILKIPKTSEIVVGCANGVDQYIRTHFATDKLKIFYAKDYGQGRSAFARRSIALVNYLNVKNGCLCAFPSNPCPISLNPSAKSSECFCGLGTGTWSTIAYAIGLNIPCYVYTNYRPNWQLKDLGYNWFTNIIN